MSDALFAVQDAVFDVLSASASLQTKIGTPPRLYDHVMPDAAFPFVTLGGAQASPYDTKDRSGMTQIVALHVWSRYRGHKEVKEIIKILYDTLHNASLTITGHDFVLCHFDSADMQLDGDGLSYHGVARYRIVTQSL